MSEVSVIAISSRIVFVKPLSVPVYMCLCLTLTMKPQHTHIKSENEILNCCVGQSSISRARSSQCRRISPHCM